MRASFARLLLLVLIACASLYLIGNAHVDLWDRDEPRYAQTSRQMLDSGDFVVPRLLDTVRTAKPIFIYWCQALCMKLLGATDPDASIDRLIFAARLPSVIAMLATLSVVGLVLARQVGPRRAIWTIFILGTAGLTIAAAKMCITDSVLLLFVTLAQIALAAIYLGRRSWGIVLLLWVAFGLAALTKGPVVLGVQFTTLLVLTVLDVVERVKGSGNRSLRNHFDWNHWRSAIGWWRHTRPLLGLLIIAAIVAPWLYMIELRSPGFLRQTILHDVWTRSIKPLEGHKGPPGFYLLTVWVTYFPWSILLPTAATLAFKHRNLPHIRFAIAAVIGPWLMMEFVQTKLVHYVMPAFPPLTFLTADALVRCIRKQHDDLHRPIFVKFAAIWALLVIGAGLLPWFVSARFEYPPVLNIVMATFSVAGVAYAAVVFVRFRQQRIAAGALALGGGMILVISIFYGLYLPNASFLWIPQRVATILNRHDSGRPGDSIMIDFKEDSLPVYHRNSAIRERDDDYLLTHPPAEWPTYVVLTREILDALPPERSALLEPLGSVKGLAYADGGRRVEVLVMRKKG